MNTALEKMIYAIEQGYNKNEYTWSEWKEMLLNIEKQQIKKAFIDGLYYQEEKNCDAPSDYFDRNYNTQQ